MMSSTRCPWSTTGSAASPTSWCASRTGRRDACIWEPVDAKLARAEAKPGHVLQLCFYADALMSAHRARRPSACTSGSVRVRRRPSVTDEFRPYWRRLRRNSPSLLDGPTSEDPLVTSRAALRVLRVPGLCDDANGGTRTRCIYVAGIRKPERLASAAAASRRSAALAAGRPDGPRPGSERLDAPGRQAALQVAARDDGSARRRSG